MEVRKIIKKLKWEIFHALQNEKWTAKVQRLAGWKEFGWRFKKHDREGAARIAGFRTVEKGPLESGFTEVSIIMQEYLTKLHGGEESENDQQTFIDDLLFMIEECGPSCPTS